MPHTMLWQWILPESSSAALGMRSPSGLPPWRGGPGRARHREVRLGRRADELVAAVQTPPASEVR